jgi:hypothetical protein
MVIRYSIPIRCVCWFWVDKSYILGSVAVFILRLVIAPPACYIQRLTQKVWKYAKLASKQVTGGYGAKITAPGEVAPKRAE